ncbi:MAG: VWA domain-containing protein, partial [Candidatus Aminicenantes bacterium]|nr:VWA domain-containing protein [Candidatus Aminicenantes bacterium]
IKGKTEHANFIFDNDNNVTFSTRGDIDFSLFSQERIYSYTILSLPPGMYKCRTIIRNLKTGRAAVATSLVDVPEPLKSGMRLYQPLLLIPEKKSVFIKLTKDSKKDVKKELLSLNDIYPFISNKHSPLINVSDKDVSKLLAVVRCSFVDIQKPEVNISALLVEHASKKKIPLSLSILSSENQEDTVVLLIELQLPELITGRYSLNIVAEEVNTQSKSEVNTDFSVR